MGTHTRLGSYLLTAELASDPFGAIHRAVVTAGSNFDRHVLVRTFSKEWFHAGMNVRLAEAGRVVPLLAGAKSFGQGYQIEGGERPLVAWDHVPGRSLARLIDKAKQEQIPFGVDHALAVLQGVAQGIVAMHTHGVSHGVLSPHSVWVSFDGTTQLVDAPFAPLATSLLAKAPSARQRLAPYLQGPANDALHQDLFALGAMLYELLTFECLPLGGDLRAALDQATLKAAQEEAPIPTELGVLLARLLGQQPFTTVEAFSAVLERVLYEGEYGPTAFHLAFFMHTLFREENDRDATAMGSERSDHYPTYTASVEPASSGAIRAEPVDGLPEARSSQKKTALLIGGGLFAVAVLGLGYVFLGRQRTDPAIQKQLEELQSLKAQKADLEAKARAEGDKTAQLQKQLTETKSAEEKSKIQKQIEEAQQRRLDLERQQKEAEQRLVEQRQNEQKLTEQRQAEQRQNEQKQAEQKLASESKPAVPPSAQSPAPVPEVPTPQPAPEPPKAAAPEPAIAQPGPAAAPIYEPARIVNQIVPIYPQRAIQMRWGTNQTQRVRLKVFVGEQGQALKVSLIEGVGGSFGFDEAAIEAANKSTYTPATRDGKPVRGWTPEIVYAFLKRN